MSLAVHHCNLAACSLLWTLVLGMGMTIVCGCSPGDCWQLL